MMPLYRKHMLYIAPAEALPYDAASHALEGRYRARPNVAPHV